MVLFKFFLFLLIAFSGTINSYSQTSIASEWVTLGNKKFYVGDYTSAISFYSASITSDNKYFEAYSMRGIAKSELNEHQSAKIDFDKALRLEPDNIFILKHRAETLQALNLKGKALDDLKKVKTLEMFLVDSANVVNKEKELDGKSYVDCFNLGCLNKQSEEYEKAIFHLTRCLTINPLFYQAYLERGLSKYALKDYASAKRDLQKVISIRQDVPQVYYYLGWISFKGKYYDEAVRNFDTVIVLNPNYLSIYSSRGKAYFRMKRYEEAYKDFTRFSPSYNQLNDISEVLIILGKENEALRNIEQTLESNLPIQHNIIAYYLSYIAKVILSEETEQDEGKIIECYNSLKKDRVKITWSFDTFNEWIVDSKINSESKDKIMKQSNLLETLK